jgi:hypothetical protein
MLSLIAAPDPAASIVGDLVEASPAGRVSWISLARIGISLLWKDVCARPGRMLYLATAGAFLNLVILATFGAAFFLIAILLGLFGALLHRDVTIAVDPWFACLVLCAAVPAPFMTGRWIARRSQSQELAPCLVLTVLAFTVWCAFCLAYGQQVELMNGLSGILPTLACLTVAAFSLNAGAIWRRNHARSASLWFERVPFEENWARRKSLWDLCNPADLEQQRICDAVLLMTVPVLLVKLPTTPRSLDIGMHVSIGALLLFGAIANRPLQWMGPSSRLAALFGRLLFLGLAILLALSIS